MGQKYSRILQLPDITHQSTFLWGPRKVGKSTWIRENLQNFIYIDLLKSDTFAEYASRPWLLRERFEVVESPNRPPIIIDEIQKCPQLLDEVHWLIENVHQSFLLTGSSARKLRRQHANLLGGRAWRREMRPLCFPELCPNTNAGLDLQRIVLQGLLPGHYAHDNYMEELRAYVADYLKDEIAGEAEMRHLPTFAEFLRVAAITCAELLNYTNVAREVGVSAKVVKSYFEILEDTLLGFRVQPWTKSKNRRMVETEKFYLFDVGVSNYLARRTPFIGSAEFGKSFEHWILMELLAYRSYRAPELEISFWRTSNKQEVDFILNDKQVAIEIKASEHVDQSDIKHLSLLCEDGPVKKRIIVCREREPKTFTDKYGPIYVMPIRDFMERLWGGLVN